MLGIKILEFKNDNLAYMGVTIIIIGYFLKKHLIY